MSVRVDDISRTADRRLTSGTTSPTASRSVGTSLFTSRICAEDVRHARPAPSGDAKSRRALTSESLVPFLMENRILILFVGGGRATAIRLDHSEPPRCESLKIREES